MFNCNGFHAVRPSLLVSWLTAAVLAAQPPATSRAQTPIQTTGSVALTYVDSQATGPTHDGSSWCRAMLTLSQAVAIAIPGTTIRVANGVHRPDSSGLPDARQATFPLLDGVSIEGGYAGCGAANPDERDFAAHETVLSGDLLGNDPPAATFRGCCRPTYQGPCPDADCAAAVCAQYPLCCTIQWEDVCAATAATICPTLCSARDDNSFHVVTGSGTDATAELDGFTITQGHADYPVYESPNARGAGLYADSGSPSVRNCTFRANDARELGGGAFFRDSNTTVTGCTFDDNMSRNYFTEGNASGGGAYVEGGSPVIDDCTFSRNGIDGFGTGAGLFTSNSNAWIRDSRFEDNAGPGITATILSGAITIEGCVASGNVGAFGFSGPGSVVIRRCLVVGNSGGIGVVYGSAQIINTIVTGNTGYKGAGLGCHGATVAVHDCTIVNNTAGARGGGIYCQYDAQVSVINSIVWGNAAPAGAQIDLGNIGATQPSTMTVSYSDVQGGRESVSGVGNLVWGAGNVDANPKFVDALGVDGIEGTGDENWRLVPHSPCIDLGDNAALPAGVTSDFDGKPRILDGDGNGSARVDMGAFEAPAPIPSTSAAMLGAGVVFLVMVGSRILQRRRLSILFTNVESEDK